MSENPVSLRNISPEVIRGAQAISRRSGLSISDIIRLALVSGILIELTKVGPDLDGLYGGFDEAYLAKLLRRHLAAAIDLLLEQGQHPHQGMMFTPTNATSLPTTNSPANPSDTMMFDEGLADELEEMGMGMGLSLGFAEEPASVEQKG